MALPIRICTRTLPLRLSALLCAILTLLLLAVAGAPSNVHAQEPVPIERISDMPTKWRADRQLYVKGRTNIPRMSEISKWLKENAPHWTVVIAANGDNESYTENGQQLTGLDAANTALSRGLRANEGFANLVNDIEQRDGAILFFLQRDSNGKSQVVYYSSRAQQMAGLGDEAWQGNLDATALSALANGARYFDAIKDTIKNIDKQLEEKTRGERDRRQKLEGIAEAYKDHAETSLWALDMKARDFASAQRTGDIAKPPIAEFSAMVEKLSNQLNQGGNLKQTGEELMMLATRIMDCMVAIENYQADLPLMDEAKNRFATLKETLQKNPATTPETTEAMARAEKHLQEAQRAYDIASSQYKPALTLATRSMDEVDTSLVIASHRSRLPNVLMLAVLAIVAFLAVAAVAFVLVTANRPIQQRAQALLRQREAELSHVPARALDLMDRARLIIGAGADTELRFNGQTLHEAREILREVDGLYLDASAAMQNVAQARNLLGTDSAKGAMAMFFSKPHWQAEALLHDDVTVLPDAMPKLLTRTEKASTRAPGDNARLASGSLLGYARDHQAHTLAWQNFTQQFKERVEKAELHLASLSQSLQTPAVEIARIRAELDELVSTRKEASVLKAAHVYDTLIPATRAACLKAEEQAVRDPLGAMEKQVPEASRMSAQARKLVEVNDDLREKKAPRLLKIAEFLKQHKIRDSWVRTGLSELDTKIEQLAQDCVTRDIAEDTDKVQETGASLLSRADGSVGALAALNKLHQDRESRAASLPEARAELTQKIAAALAESKGRTAPEADATLKEPGREAERFLRVAEAQLDIARGALMNGDTPAALHAVEIGEESLASFDESITQSREAAEKFVARKAALRQEAKQLLSEAPRATAILDYLQKNFHPGALVLAEAPEDANATITDNISEFEAAMRRTAELLAAAEANLAKAAPFKAAGQLDQATAAIQAGRVRLSEITTTAGELRLADGRNTEALANLQQRINMLSLNTQQRTVTAATRTMADELCATFAKLSEEASALPRNPTSIDKQITTLTSQANVLDAKLLADRESHEEMLQALRSAEAHLVPARDAASSFKVEQATYPDEARAAIAGIEAAQRRFNSARQASREDYADWAAIANEMNDVSVETARHMAVLRGNTETAAPVLVAMDSAGKAVIQAVSWVGPRGVRIAANPGSTSVSTSSGSHDLANAHSLLAVGQLADAAITAARALHQAEASLRDAEARVRRDDYEEEQQRLAAKSRFEDLQKQREWRKQQGGTTKDAKETGAKPAQS